MKPFLPILLWIIFAGHFTNLNAQNEHWRFDFDGKIDGETYDIIKSPIDGKIYFGGGFLSANGNTDLKNLARWNPENSLWEQVPGKALWQ